MASTSVLFVCLGNICRSPMAEGIFRMLVADAGLADEIEIDSAGTGNWHTGEDPHVETQAEFARRGHAVKHGTARQATPADIERFDYVVAMDGTNLAALRLLAQNAHDPADITLLLDETVGGDVPDPYFEGGFDGVYELIEPACEALLARIRAEQQL